MTLPRISELSNEAVRVMVAEAAGWNKNAIGGYSLWIHPTTKRTIIPNYPTSLDAVAPVLATMTDVDHARYRNILHDIVKPTDTTLHVLEKAFRHERNYVSASARQHCDAFLVATGKATL